MRVAIPSSSLSNESSYESGQDISVLIGQVFVCDQDKRNSDLYDDRRKQSPDDLFLAKTAAAAPTPLHRSLVHDYRQAAMSLNDYAFGDGQDWVDLPFRGVDENSLQASTEASLATLESQVASQIAGSVYEIQDVLLEPVIQVVVDPSEHLASPEKIKMFKPKTELTSVTKSVTVLKNSLPEQNALMNPSNSMTATTGIYRAFLKKTLEVREILLKYKDQQAA